MLIEVNPSSGVPIYLQVKNQVKKMIASGILKSNEPLTSVRQLAVELRVNPNTIAKAYRDMEVEGVLYTRRGKGIFVAGKSSEKEVITKGEKLKMIAPIAEQLAVEAFHIGLNAHDVEKLVKEKLADLEGRDL